jgi:predicted PurR-regulated permease PerM
MSPMITDSQKWLVLAGMLLLCWLLYLLSPVLTPFFIAALLAYLGDPLVDWLESHGSSRTLATSIVVVLFALVIVLVPLLLLPVLQKQATAFVRAIPGFLDWAATDFVPWVQANLGIDLTIPDVAKIKSTLAKNLNRVGDVAVELISYASRSGVALAGWLASMVLIPVVVFYMLRDWDKFIAGIHDLLPRHLEPTVSKLARDSDQMLGAFLRGQLTVMVCLGIVYSIGLKIAGLEWSLTIGMLAGLVSFVPYLGVIFGLLTASIAVMIQSQDVVQLVWVLLVFGAGQMLEGMILTPWLVGDRVGLHPVAVIFAVLAGGQLFGFMGILLALPVASVLAVLLRHARARYRESGFYGEIEEVPRE